MRNTIIAIVVIVLIVLGFWLFNKPKAKVLPDTQNNIALTEGEKIGASVMDAGSVVGESVGKTNPFEVKVNPYDGYKNPFSK